MKIFKKKKTVTKAIFSKRKHKLGAKEKQKNKMAKADKLNAEKSFQENKSKLQNQSKEKSRNKTIRSIKYSKSSM